MKKTAEYSVEKLTQMLQAKGIRPSAQRIAVFSAVANGRMHPAAEDIYAGLSKLFHSLSRTTVYNSLKVMTDAGLLRELEIEAGCSRYDMALQPAHSHFICRRCSRIYDMPMPEGMSEILAPQFDIDAVEVTLRGLCPECRNSMDESDCTLSRDRAKEISII